MATRLKTGRVELIGTVLPGDQVLRFNPKETTDKIYLGPGLRWQDNAVRATRPGILKCDNSVLFYVDTHQKRYIPQRSEFVIGIVIKKKGENYVVDIAGHEPATISYLAFENASKKTRTDVKLGDLIYGQLIVANKDMEPELVCIDVYDRAVGMGVLPSGGLLFTVPLHIARSIINPENPFLLRLSKRLSYSIVIGFNGRIWVRAKQPSEIIAIMHAINMLEFMSLEEAENNVNDLIDSFIIHSIM